MTALRGLVLVLLDTLRADLEIRAGAAAVLLRWRCAATPREHA